MKAVHAMKEHEINLINQALKSLINEKNKEGGTIKLSELDTLFSDDEGQSDSDQTTI